MSGIRFTFTLGIVLATTLAAVPGRAEDDTLPPPTAEQATAVEPADAPYDPVGRRDPFRPPRVGSAAGAEGRTPLQRYDVGQLRLVAVIYETKDPRAVVEDDQGLGYIVKIGTLIGPNGGKVSAIERGKVVIAEDDAAYAPEGANKVTMELRPSDDATPRRASERGKR
jgi:hypothetical protein